MPSRLFVAVGLLAAAACFDSRPTHEVAHGTWGGDHVRLTVTAEGGQLEFDCAHGAMTAPLMVEADDHFSVPGYFVREHGGPVRDGEAEERRPTVYAGEVDAPTLTFTFGVDGETAGPFTVAFGRPARLTKCL
jgi:hypothetical protein